MSVSVQLFNDIFLMVAWKWSDGGLMVAGGHIFQEYLYSTPTHKVNLVKLKGYFQEEKY